MLKRKRIRTKGKVSLNKYFQNFDSGDYVALVRELSRQKPGFPERMQGKTGRIIEKKGAAYVVEIGDYDMKKRFSVRPIHLKKIEGVKA